jgi:hypothetical protein
MADFELDDVLVIEGEIEGDEAVSIQRAINSGTGWSLQGSYGRAMMRAIEAGEAMLGPNASYDAYGNKIPARSEVAPGTKGSREFVVEAMGEDYAAKLDKA